MTSVTEEYIGSTTDFLEKTHGSQTKGFGQERWLRFRDMLKTELVPDESFSETA